jgi:toxin-antitoxin system PIN domain toxin
MTSLVFPDVNVWLALLLADHTHRESAARWWKNDSSELIFFSRFTQMSVLRLLTTPAVMGGKPLSMRAAWTAYDRFFQDSRVAFVIEPEEVERRFRKNASSLIASPKVWADAYLLAFSEKLGATLVTFDRDLADKGEHCLLLTL